MVINGQILSPNHEIAVVASEVDVSSIEFVFSNKTHIASYESTPFEIQYKDAYGNKYGYI